MALHKRKFGETDMEITTVGLGTWAIGGGGWAFGWGPQDDEVSIASIRKAVTLGINWVDTAAIYGLGHCEEVVGRALREIPANERPLVFTKCGLIPDRTQPMVPPKRTLRPESIRRECEASLQRLGIERIDLYQFHQMDEGGTPVEESWGEMQRLIREGKVRAGGLSNFTIELMERCERVGRVDSLQPPFSMIRRDAGAELLPWCAAHGTGAIVYSPMQAGLLTDSFEPERMARLPQDDWRRRSREFQEPNLSRNMRLRDALRPIARRHSATVSSVAIAWTLVWRGVTAAIAGARSPEQVDGWIRAGEIALTEQDLGEITEALTQSQAGTGPLNPGALQAGAR